MTGLSIHIRRKLHRSADRSQKLALQDLRLELGPSEFVCLVGPSGCGKTTLLNIIAGLDRDFEGSIAATAGGQPPRIGYVFQNPRLLPWRTVRQNVEVALCGDIDHAEINHLFEIVGLSGAENVYPERLSLGMSRRVSLVRAFAVNPDLLLMDEPFVSLDPPTARRVRELVVRLWRERPHTVLFVTHDLREAIELADRLVFLSSSPATVVRGVSVDIPREARSEARIEAFRQSLAASYPDLADLL